MARLKSILARVSLRTKVVGALLLQTMVLGAVSLGMFAHQVRTTAKEETVAQARRIVRLGESVRHGVAKQWNTGVYDHAKLAEWSRAGEVHKVLSTVPIVSAWHAVMDKANEGGYAVRVVRTNARNPKNLPDATEAVALNTLAKDSTLDEYVIEDRAHNAIRYFRPIKLTQECLICHGDPESSQSLWGNAEGLDATGYEMEGLKAGDFHGAFEIVQSLDAADQLASRSVLRGVLLLGALTVIASSILACFLNSSLLSPITTLLQLFERVGKGDLRTTVNVERSDEIGRLQAGINTMVLRLRHLIESLHGKSQDLASASSCLDDTAHWVQEAVLNTSSRSDSVAAAAEQMSMTLYQMNENVQDVSRNVQTVATATEQLESSTESIAACSKEAASVTQEAAEYARTGCREIHELEAAAKDIGDVVNMIQAIAEQTNILALNATIESSRAGAAGQAFAVVASEVKQLAQQSAAATCNVRNKITTAQSISGRVVEAMESIERVVGKAKERTDEIARSITEQRQAIRLIADQLHATAAGLKSSQRILVKQPLQRPMSVRVSPRSDRSRCNRLTKRKRLSRWGRTSVKSVKTSKPCSAYLRFNGG